MSINWQGMYENERALRLKAEAKAKSLLAGGVVQEDFAAKLGLTSSEYRALVVLSRVGTVTKAQMRAVFSPRNSGQLAAEKSLQSRISTLRKKVSKIKGRPIRIVAIYGHGYRMAERSRKYVADRLEHAK